MDRNDTVRNLTGQVPDTVFLFMADSFYDYLVVL